MTSIAVLALAIGANAAMFSVLHAALLKPLPYRSPDQLAMLWSEIPSQGAREARSAYVNVEQWRSQSKSFADLAVFDPVSVTVTTAAGAEHIGVCRVSPNFFSLLGVQPVQGRSFSAEEADQRQHLVLISHRFWVTRFGGAPDTLGATKGASLSLARSVSREREIAIRAALGASRARIVRQLLTESLTLAVASGLLGLLVALAVIRVVLAAKPGNLARLNEIGLDPQVLGWNLALCFLTGILVGLAPAITMARRNLTPSGHEGARGSSGGVATRRIRRALVTSEFAFAIILLVVARLLIRSP